MPLFAHLALVLAAGIYLPAPLVAWFQSVARLLGRGAADGRGSPTCSRQRPPGRAHRPWPRVVVDETRGSRPCRASPRARRRCSACGATPRPCIWRCCEDDGAIGVAQPACPERPLPIRRPRCIRRPCGWSAPSATCSGWSPRAARTRGRWLDHGRWGVRQPLGAQRAGACQRRCLRLPPGRRPAAAPDPGRPGARRHHRARPLPLHRQRRDRRAPGGAAGLRAQGHRRPDGRRAARARRRSSPAASRATARSPTPSPSPAPSRRRSGSSRRRARSGCAR